MPIFALDTHNTEGDHTDAGRNQSDVSAINHPISKRPDRSRDARQQRDYRQRNSRTWSLLGISSG
jgi:hypothetical protein